MSRLRAYAQLIRLPNLPTTLADLCLAALALTAWRPTPELAEAFPLLPFLALLGTSLCLYAAGMVWNDYFDQDQDRRERPFRPLPSGRIRPAEAVRLGVALLLAGLLLAFLVNGTAFGVALLLAGCILLYDGWLKRTWAGPVAMGSCRFLNVLLGLSLAGFIPWPGGAHLAGVVGMYIVGVTWLARTEARLSNQRALAGAGLILLLSLLLAVPLALPAPESPARASPLFPYLLVALGFFVGIPVVRAIRTPTPERVQPAVGRCLMGLVLLDAVLATAVAGEIGLLIALLLVPVILLRRMRWLYAT